MTTSNIHFLIIMGFFTVLVLAISATSVLNARAGVHKARARAREAHWRAQYRSVPASEPGDEPGEGQQPGEDQEPGQGRSAARLDRVELG